jgi:hypothetical protein
MANEEDDLPFDRLPFESLSHYNLRKQEEKRRVREWRETRSMNTAELKQISFWPCNSVDLVAECYMTNSQRPSFPKDQHERPSIKGPLKLTMLDMWPTICRYGNHKNSTSFDVWNMVCMDGSYGLIRVAFNSSMKTIRHEEMHPGTLVTMGENDWRVIYNKDSSDGFKRGILFVDKAEFSLTPSTISKEDKEEGHVTPDHCCSWIDS